MNPVFIHRNSALVMLFALSATVIFPQRAAAAPSNEYALLQMIPHAVLDKIESDAMPDENGAVQLNRGRWTDIVYQRVALPLIWIGAAQSNSAKVDQGWRAIDLANSHLQNDGSYDTAQGRVMNASEMAMWVQGVAHALVVLKESPLGAKYQGRIQSELPQLRKSVDWLKSPNHMQELLKFDTPAANRLFVDAGAFAYSAQLLGDPSPKDQAEFFARQALSRQRDDGTFLEENGFDSSYQGVSLLHGTYLALTGSSEPLQEALSKAMAREVSAVNANGALDTTQNTRTGGSHMVNGHRYTVDYRSVILGLYYAGLYLDDASAVHAAERLFTRAYRQSPNA